jgi:hypothetical protein
MSRDSKIWTCLCLHVYPELDVICSSLICSSLGNVAFRHARSHSVYSSKCKIWQGMEDGSDFNQLSSVYWGGWEPANWNSPKADREQWSSAIGTRYGTEPRTEQLIANPSRRPWKRLPIASGWSGDTEPVLLSTKPLENSRKSQWYIFLRFEFVKFRLNSSKRRVFPSIPSSRAFSAKNGISFLL